MLDLCTACLCADRKLRHLQDTDFTHLYTQILSEISVYLDSELEVCIQLCWECVAILRRFERFKQRVKSSYFLLRECAQMDMSKLEVCQPSHLQIHHQPLSVVSIAECCKDEDMDCLTYDVDCLAQDASLEIKTECVPHEEPETFVHELSVPQRGLSSVSPVPPPVQSPPRGEGDGQPTTGDTQQRDKTNKRKDKKKTPKVKKKVKPKTKSTKIKLKSKKSNGMKSNCDEEFNTECANETDDEDDIPLAESKTETATQDSIHDNNREHTETVLNIESESAPDRHPVPAPEPVPEPAVKTKLPDRPTCAECGKQFSSKKTYRYHMNVLHKGNNSHPCPRCDRVFQWKSNLGRHMRSHKAADGDELYCALCDKRFASIATYRQHLAISRRHVPENQFPFTCNECGKKFVSKTRLRDHTDWEHLHNIKFRCTLCHKAFKCHTSLYVHRQNVHRDRDTKDNLCHVCGKSYQNAAKLKYHIVAMHTSQTPYQCSQCSAAFGWYSSLYRHVREVHYRMKVQHKKSKRSKKHDAPSTVPPPPAPPPPPPHPPIDVTHTYIHHAV